jgi:tRNA-dihydrouridine synthase
MEFYFAPLEGITGYIYRSAHHAFYPGMDKYFTPFLSPNQNRALNPKEMKDIMQEHNQGMHTIPQILTNQAEYFLRAAAELKEKYGYEEVNLNLGCPSGTVVSKGKGAGFLAKPEELDVFLEQIFEKADVRVSVKTRIGMAKPEEFYHILELFNKYPLYELIVHPRVQKDFYKNKPDWDMFAEAVRISRNPLCYNGDIFTVAEYKKFRETFPSVERVMIGRGLLVNPALVQEAELLEGGMEETAECGSAAAKKTIRNFHDRLYAQYREELSGETPRLYKMKELWSYMVCLFTDYEKYWKKIKKVSRLCDYNEIIRRLFTEQELRRL